MMRSLWTSKTGMEAQQFQLDVVSHNLANVSTNGYKRSHLKALDSIQLASLIHAADEVEAFVVCDQQLKKYALKEGFPVIDPTE